MHLTGATSEIELVVIYHLCPMVEWAKKLYVIK